VQAPSDAVAIVRHWYIRSSRCISIRDTSAIVVCAGSGSPLSIAATTAEAGW
jgi:hypothetical protein